MQVFMFEKGVAWSQELFGPTPFFNAQPVYSSWNYPVGLSYFSSLI